MPVDARVWNSAVEPHQRGSRFREGAHAGRSARVLRMCCTERAREGDGEGQQGGCAVQASSIG